MDSLSDSDSDFHGDFVSNSLLYAPFPLSSVCSDSGDSGPEQDMQQIVKHIPNSDDEEQDPPDSPLRKYRLDSDTKTCIRTFWENFQYRLTSNDTQKMNQVAALELVEKIQKHDFPIEFVINVVQKWPGNRSKQMGVSSALTYFLSLCFKKKIIKNYEDMKYINQKTPDVTFYKVSFSQKMYGYTDYAGWNHSAIQMEVPGKQIT